MTVKNGKPGFWDNLIPPKGGLFGAQLAGWTPGPAAKSALGCRVLADQMIEVAPSIALAADVYVPKAPGRYPAVLAFSGYFPRNCRPPAYPPATTRPAARRSSPTAAMPMSSSPAAAWAARAGRTRSISTTPTWRTTPGSSNGPQPSPGATGRWCYSAPPITG